MSYNVRAAGLDEGVDAWVNRRATVTGAVRLHRPATVGLQEVVPEQYDDVREALPAYEWVGEGRQGSESNEATPVGYRADRFDLADSGTFWLSETPDQPGKGWDADCPRVATWVHLEDRETGERLIHVNTHLDHQGAEARRESAALLRDRFADRDASLVFTGDFNCMADSEPLELLTAEESPLVHAVDVCETTHHGPETTFTSFDSLVSAGRIDHVFVDDDVRVTGHATATDMRPDGRFPSDHLPLVVDLELGD
ncbi:Endonuclease/exonuclease/phosphatase [Candidatus Halobonum tyrrellensis G22]|uniref:Endonuclease/exonuclease/phosphatase n=2 Tax=Candidatus Halobonum TaxID=1431544 RepID=V4IZY2_9EURY|nr:Endonuclease/exonuclease/phosphatase [Candidatus Halobonum tyrrellensis G22]